jgi:uncharacterized membrane protein
MFIVGVAFDWLAVRTQKVTFTAAAFLNLNVAAASVFPVLLSGLVVWRWQLEGQRMKGVRTDHPAELVDSLPRAARSLLPCPLGAAQRS